MNKVKCTDCDNREQYGVTFICQVRRTVIANPDQMEECADFEPVLISFELEPAPIGDPVEVASDAGVAA